MKILCNVAGITFRNKDEWFETARPSGRAVLKHNPDNEFDPNAVEVYIDARLVGYLKKDSFAQEFIVNNPGIDTALITGYAYAEKANGDLEFNHEHIGRLSSISLEVSDGGDDVTLDEDNNYIIGDRKFMRLSKVCSHFNPDPDNPGLDRWKIGHESYDEYIKHLNELSRAGTAMHDAIEKWIKDGVESELIPDGFWNFIKKHEVEFVKEDVEAVIVNSDLSIAGRGDAGAYCMVGPKKDRKRVKAWLDWKSSKKPTKKHVMSTSWYGAEKGYDEAWVIAFGADTKQGFSLKRVDNDEMHSNHEAVCCVKEAIDLING